MSRVEQHKYSFAEELAEAYCKAVDGDVASQKWLKDCASAIDATAAVSSFVLARVSFYQQPHNKQAALSYLLHLKTYLAATPSNGLKREVAVLSKICHLHGSEEGTLLYIKHMSEGIGMQQDFNAACAVILESLKKCEIGTDQAKQLLEMAHQLAVYAPESIVVLMALSEIYRHGYGCIADQKRANECDQVAANLGSLVAFFRLHPDPLTINDLFQLAMEGSHAAYKTLAARAELSGDQEGLKRGKHLVALCKLHGYGTRQQLVTKPVSFDDLSRMEFKAERRSAEAFCIASSYLSSRHKVGVFGGGYYFLENQIKLNLMLLGLHEKKYRVAAHCESTSGGIYQQISLNTIAKYTNVYASSLFDGERIKWKALANNLMQACHQPTPDSIKSGFLANKPINAVVGWYEHVVSITFFKLGDKYYLAYGNKGDRAYGNKSSIKFFQVHDPSKLFDQDWLRNLHTSHFSKAYLEMHDPDYEGLGKDLGLELAGTINCDDQKGGNCAVLASSVTARINLMHGDFKQQYASHPTTFVLNAEAINDCDKRIKMPVHKRWRFAMRQRAVSMLCDLGAKHEGMSLSVSDHFDLLQTVIAGIHEKYPHKDEASREKRRVLLREIQVYLKSKNCSFSETQITALSEHMQGMKALHESPPAIPEKTKRHGIFSRFRRAPAVKAVETKNPLVHVARVTMNPFHGVAELTAI
ncbi:MAG: hypothetical protein P1U63_09335 [Coxiellaceae bacterium]|nr:hypothetical protein [Coxiellaceae bacterium]